LRKLPGVRLPFSAPFFNEFVVDLGREAATIHQELVAEKIIAGVPLARWYSERRNELLLCVTETTTRDDLDRFVNTLKELLAG
jgi:glycine dehydrogenase subunit 1